MTSTLQMQRICGILAGACSRMKWLAGGHPALVRLARRIPPALGVLIASTACSNMAVDDLETLGVSRDALTTATIWGFEDASAWTVTTGTATKQTSTTHDEGSLSLQLSASSFVAVRSAAVVKPTALSPLLAVDIMIPTQAGPYYWGALQMSINVPSLNIYSAWVNQKQLSVPTGVWQTLTFQLPANIYSSLLASSSFSDLQISLGLNPPSGVTQPFRFDNLRFLPAPSCVDQPNGTLCDDSVTCTTGNTCNAGICGTVSTPVPGSVCDAGDDVLGFENLPAWQATNGAAALAPSTTKVQGLRSLQISTSNFSTVSSVSLATLHKVGQILSLRVQKPTNQPNSWWHGDLTLAMTVPSLGLSFSSNKALTGQPSGSFFELQFQLPTATYQSLASHTYSDLSFAISVNPPNGQSGFYLLDDLHFVPVASCTGLLDKTACEDNSVCTLGDSCFAGTCGAAISCDDNNVCTDDSCNAATGCVRTPNTASCQDGNACTTGDVCRNGACVPGAPVVCNDSNACTDDSCNPTNGACVFANNTASCSDASVCTLGDACSGGSCVPGPQISCDDGLSCSVDGCDAVAGCFHSTCPVSAFSLTIQAGSASPVDPALILTQLDNPIVSGNDQLQTITYQGPCGLGGCAPESIPEHADGTKLPNVWGFDYFKLVVHSAGDDSKGARTMDSPATGELIAKPAQAAMFDPPAMLPFAAQGIEIGYAESTVSLIHREVGGNPRPQPPVRAKLDPQVMLVPIQVIKVLPPSTASFFSELADISVPAVNRLFDSRRPLIGFETSQPGYPIVRAQYKLAPLQGMPLDFTEPDTIWAQCGIQFRAVSCSGTDAPGLERCPDLNITQGFNVSAIGAQCNITPQGRVHPGTNGSDTCGCESVIQRHNRDDARMLPGVRSDLPMVMLTGAVSDRRCGVNGSIVDLAETGVAYMGALNQTTDTAPVLAHELGHVLGLNHNSTVPNVMHPQLAQTTAFVSQDMCAAARSQAAVYVKAKWGITVDPGQWTVTPPFQR